MRCTLPQLKNPGGNGGATVGQRWGAQFSYINRSIKPAYIICLQRVFRATLGVVRNFHSLRWLAVACQVDFSCGHPEPLSISESQPIQTLGPKDQAVIRAELRGKELADYCLLYGAVASHSPCLTPTLRFVQGTTAILFTNTVLGTSCTVQGSQFFHTPLFGSFECKIPLPIRNSFPS